MHRFVHRYAHSGRMPAETQEHILNLGLSYDLMAWICDRLLGGSLRELRQRTMHLARIQPGDHVLDVGCGTGTLALEAQQRTGASGQVRGIDPGPQQIARARAKAAEARLPAMFSAGAIERLDFPDETFDVVLSTIMFHHLHGDLKRQGLAEVRRVLKPGGRLVIADFQHPYADRHAGTDRDAGGIAIQPLAKLVAAAGFSGVAVEQMPLPRRPGLPSLFSQGAGFVSAQKPAAANAPAGRESADAA